MHRIYFTTLELAITHACAAGGWLAICNDGSFQWFDAARWQLTPIARAIARDNGGGEVGTVAQVRFARVLFDEPARSALAVA